MIPEHIGDNLKNYLKNEKSEIISIIGDSTDPKIIAQVYSLVDSFQKEFQVMVTLDSNHTADHVAKELASYSDLVSPGQYLIVQDTYLGYYCGSDPLNLNYTDDPLAAVEVFLTLDNRFEIDTFPQRWIITQSPFGFLKRK